MIEKTMYDDKTQKEMADDIDNKTKDLMVAILNCAVKLEQDAAKQMNTKPSTERKILAQFALTIKTFANALNITYETTSAAINDPKNRIEFKN